MTISNPDAKYWLDSTVVALKPVVPGPAGNVVKPDESVTVADELPCLTLTLEPVVNADTAAMSDVFELLIPNCTCDCPPPPPRPLFHTKHQVFIITTLH